MNINRNAQAHIRKLASEIGDGGGIELNHDRYTSMKGNPTMLGLAGFF